jgi:hypothetical protein
VGATAVTLNVSFVVVDAVAAGGFITVVIPAEIGFIAGYLPQCQLYIASSSTVPSCSVSNSTFTIPLITQALSSSQKVVVSLKGFGTNPSSTLVTSPFSIYTHSPDNYLVDYSNSSYQYSGFTAAPFASLQLTPSNLNNSAPANYLLTLTQNSQWDNNSYLLLDLPPTVTASTPACLNTTDNSSLPCTLLNASRIRIELPLRESTASISISGLFNPPSFRPAAPFGLASYSPLNHTYSIDSFITVTTSMASTFSSLSYSFGSLTYDTPSNLSLIVTNRVAISNQYQLSSLGQFVNASLANASCQSPQLSLSCSLNGSTLVVFPANFSSFPITVTLQIMGLYIPLANTTSMSLSSYEGGYLVSSHNGIGWQAACVLPCLTC